MVFKRLDTPTPAATSDHELPRLPDHAMIHPVVIRASDVGKADIIGAGGDPFTDKVVNLFNDKAFAFDSAVVESTTVCVSDYEDGSSSIGLVVATQNSIRTIGRNFGPGEVDFELHHNLLRESFGQAVTNNGRKDAVLPGLIIDRQ